MQTIEAGTDEANQYASERLADWLLTELKSFFEGGASTRGSSQKSSGAPAVDPVQKACIFPPMMRP